MANKLRLIQIAQVTFMVRSHQEERLIDQLDYQTENGQSEPNCLPTQGGGENLNELFGNCMPRLFRVADCVLHNCHDSEDALQDGLLSALRHIAQFKGNAQFSTWLFAIVRNAALAKLRKQRAHPTVSMDEQVSEEDFELGWTEVGTDPGPDPERACAQAELSNQFARTLEDLPP